MFPLPQLDNSSSEPLYRQLHGFIKQEILAGRLARGERIPPTRELAGLLGLNRTTVAAAYELLETDGLIRGHVGRGSFVAGGSEPAPASFPWQERLLVLPDSESPAPAPNGIKEIASFVSSRPSERQFPVAEFRATCAEVLASPEAARVLQLGSPMGYEPLREWLLDEARQAGIARPSDDLSVTSGCQQALDLLQRLLASSGETVLVEDPVYPGLKNVFAAGGVRCVGVPMTPQGMDLEVLERTLARERARLVVVTPNFQNPTGITMPLGARESLLRIAQTSGAAVIENDIYGALRYAGEPLPTLKQLDESGSVVQIRSFSKIAFPGLRTGWVIAPSAVIERLAALKQITDLHSDQLSQAVLHRFASSGRLRTHLRLTVERGADRLHAVLSACAEHLPAGSSFTRPEGGMNLWVRLPGRLDAAALAARAAAAGVSYLPGRYFAVSRVENNALRLSFAGLEPAQIRDGLAVLGRVFQQELERTHAERHAGLAPAIV